MAVTAFEPIGTTITFAAASGISLPAGVASGLGTMMASITDISMNLESSEIDVSSFASQEYKEFIGSALKDGGELSGTVHFDPNVELAKLLGVVLAITIEFRSTLGTTKIPKKKWTFNGFLKTYSFTGAIGAAMTANISIKASGKITIATLSA